MVRCFLFVDSNTKNNQYNNNIEDNVDKPSDRKTIFLLRPLKTALLVVALLQIITGIAAINLGILELFGGCQFSSSFAGIWGSGYLLLTSAFGIIVSFETRKPWISWYVCQSAVTIVVMATAMALETAGYVLDDKQCEDDADRHLCSHGCIDVHFYIILSMMCSIVFCILGIVVPSWFAKDRSFRAEEHYIQAV